MRSLALAAALAAVLSLASCKHDELRGEADRAADAGVATGTSAGSPASPAAELKSAAVGAADAGMAAAGSATAAGASGQLASAADGGAVADSAPALPAKASIEGVTLPAAPALPASPAFLGAIEDPKDNPATPEKVALGYQLFFDKRLSKDGSMSCESCHHPALAYSSGNQYDKKVNGKMNTRNSPTMENVGYASSFYWDGRKGTVEAVSEAAWTGQLGADMKTVAAQLNANAVYRAEFQRAFHEDATPKNVPQALAAFLRNLKSGDAPWDKFDGGDKKAVSKQVKRGSAVFQQARCTLCHVPPLYSDYQFHNVGIGFDKQTAADHDHGRMDFTKDQQDDGKFKTPMLRDVAKTGPYFHDGSVATLDEAIALMVKGGYANANLDEKLKPSKLGKKDLAAMKAFLTSLTGTATFTAAPELPPG